MELIKGRVIVGHDLKRDLAVLKISHPSDDIRDSSMYEPFRAAYGSGRKPALKKVVQEELGIVIQTREHDSVFSLRHI